MNGLREICAVEVRVFTPLAETVSAPAATSPTPAAADATDFRIFLLSMRLFSLVDKDSGLIINVMTKVDYFRSNRLLAATFFFILDDDGRIRYDYQFTKALLMSC
jgi:hypothetical protein